jgi:predicted small lipoprotein YifL
MRRFPLLASAVIFLALFSACGKKGPPQPPSPKQDSWKANYFSNSYVNIPKAWLNGGSTE